VNRVVTGGSSTTSHAKNDPLLRLMRAVPLLAKKPTQHAQLYIRRVATCHPKYLMEIRNGAEDLSFSATCA